MKAVYAGSFDPFTNGHLEIVKEAAQFFDEIIVLCAQNIKKKPMFSKTNMAEAIRKTLRHNNINNSVVIVSSDLTVNICKEFGALYLIRGIRNTSDYLYEEEIAKFNSMINPELKTIYFRGTLDTVSSTSVKELYTRGMDISKYVPSEVIDIINIENK